MCITVASAAITQCAILTLNNSEWRKHPVFILCPLYSGALQIKAYNNISLRVALGNSFYQDDTIGLQPPDRNKQTNKQENAFCQMNLLIKNNICWKIYLYVRHFKGEEKNGIFFCFLAWAVPSKSWCRSWTWVITVSLQVTNISLLIYSFSFSICLATGCVNSIN